MSIHELELAGDDVVLTPAHPDDAAEAWALTDAALWAGMTTPWPESPDAYAERIEQQRQTPGMLAFTVRDAETRGIRGSTTFYDHAPAQGRVEIGTTWYGRAFQGGRTNPATKLLLLEQAFDAWGLNRVALRCDARNVRSARAIERLGGVPEGRLRRHRIAADGSIGDTLYFSILREEWPGVRAGLEERLRDGVPRR